MITNGLIIDINLAKGSLLNQAGSSYNPTVTGTCGWRNTAKGKGITFGANGYLSITRDATLDAYTDLTILVFGDVPNALTGSNQHVFNKVNDYEFYFKTTGVPSLARSADSSCASADFRGAKMIGVSHVSGQKAKFYKNGSLVGETALAISAVPNTSNIGIGNYPSSPGDAFNVEGAYRRILYYNRALSDQEISQISNEIMPLCGAGDPKTSNFKHDPPPLSSDCSFAYNLGLIDGDGKIPDLSGNNRRGTRLNTVGVRLPSGLKGQKFGVGTNINFSSLSLGTVHTVEFVANKARTDTIILGDASSYVYYYYYGGGMIYYHNGVASVSWAKAYDNNEHHYIIDRNNTSVTLYIDGVSQGTKTLSSNAALPAITAVTHTTTWNWGGDIAFINVYTSSKGAAWAAMRYAQYAKKLLYTSDSKKWLPTLANVTAGQISNTEFRRVTGTWAVGEDSTGKYLLCVADGQIKNSTIKGADTSTTHTFTVSGSPTLTKNANDITIDAVAGEKIYEIALTLG